MMKMTLMALLMLISGSVFAQSLDFTIDNRITHKITREHANKHQSSKAGALAVSIDGTMAVIHADDFANGRSEFHQFVRTDKGRSIELNIQHPHGLRGGQKVRVDGTSADGGTSATTGLVDPSTVTILSEPQAATTTTAKVLVIMAKYNNVADPSYTASQAQALLADVSNFYTENSFGAEAFTTTVTSRWVTMPLPTPTSCSQTDYETYAIPAAKAANPLWDSSLYDYTVFLMQPGISCWWIGLAYVGQPHRSFIRTFSRQVVAHEMGHNHGLRHAGSVTCLGTGCQASEYGDRYSSMGNNQSAGHFDAEQKANLGWVQTSQVKTHQVSDKAESITLDPIELGNGSTYAVKIPTGIPNRTYWLEYRQAVGYDKSFPESVQVRVAEPFETTAGADDTEIVQTPNGVLSPGSTYTDQIAGITITVGPAGPAPPSATVTTVQALPNPAYAGQSISYSAFVTNSKPVLTGSVSFTDNGVALCSNVAVANATAICTSPPPTAGTHSIVASYSGDSNNLASMSAAYVETVNAGPPPPPPPFGNASFEAPTTTNYVYNPSGASWTFAGRSGVQRNGSAWRAPAAPDGSQTAFLQTQGAASSISQSFAMTAGSHTLTFQAAQRPGYGVLPISVRLDGVEVANITPDSSSVFTTYTVQINVGADGNHALSFVAAPKSGDNDSFIDSVTFQ